MPGPASQRPAFASQDQDSPPSQCTTARLPTWQVPSIDRNMPMRAMCFLKIRGHLCNSERRRPHLQSDRHTALVTHRIQMHRRETCPANTLQKSCAPSVTSLLHRHHCSVVGQRVFKSVLWRLQAGLGVMLLFIDVLENIYNVPRGFALPLPLPRDWPRRWTTKGYLVQLLLLVCVENQRPQRHAELKNAKTMKTMNQSAVKGAWKLPLLLPSNKNTNILAITAANVLFRSFPRTGYHEPSYRTAWRMPPPNGETMPVFCEQRSAKGTRERRVI